MCLVNELARFNQVSWGRGMTFRGSALRRAPRILSRITEIDGTGIRRWVTKILLKSGANYYATAELAIAVNTDRYVFSRIILFEMMWSDSLFVSPR